MGLKLVAEERIEQAFADVGTHHGGEFYLPVEAADRYIDSCLQEALAIVGVEAFRQEGEKLRPDLNQIADFSSMLTSSGGWGTIVQATVAEARRFIRQVDPDSEVRLNFTLLSEDETSRGAEEAGEP